MSNPHALTALPLASVAQVRRIEADAIEALDGDSFALMRRAAAAAWKEACVRFPAARRWIVCCGSGNNGGDGYLLAALAARAGLDVFVVNTATPATIDAARAASECVAAGLPTHEFDGEALPAADLVVDAVLGIGLDAAPRGVAARLIEAIDAESAAVFAIDVPSGLDADRGSAPGECVRASHTLTFLARKQGMHTGIAKRCCGTVALDELGAAPATDVVASVALLASRGAEGLPTQLPDDHKGRRGRALLIGGDHGMGGAILLAGEACARVGAGVITVLTRRRHVAALVSRRPELLAHGHDATDPPEFPRSDVIAIGPGLGRGSWGDGLMQRALASELPRVFDADALHFLSSRSAQLRTGDILTPHPGEAARLLGCTVAEIERERIAAVRALAARFGAICVLKGAGTLIGDPEGRVVVSPHAVPALATGGSGDVLTGIIAGLRAQGLDAWHAACVGVLVHAECGLRAGSLHGPRGVLAGDLAAHLPAVLNA